MQTLMLICQSYINIYYRFNTFSLADSVRPVRVGKNTSGGRVEGRGGGLVSEDTEQDEEGIRLD